MRPQLAIFVCAVAILMVTSGLEADSFAAPGSAQIVAVTEFSKTSYAETVIIRNSPPNEEKIWVFCLRSVALSVKFVIRDGPQAAWHFNPRHDNWWASTCSIGRILEILSLAIVREISNKAPSDIVCRESANIFDEDIAYYESVSRREWFDPQRHYYYARAFKGFVQSDLPPGDAPMNGCGDEKQTSKDCHYRRRGGDDGLVIPIYDIGQFKNTPIEKSGGRWTEFWCIISFYVIFFGFCAVIYACVVYWIGNKD